MRRPLFLLVFLILPSPAWAQPPDRERSLVVYGDDPCPEVEGEVVVCARRPEEERYRIPRPIRERQSTEVAWGSRVASLEEESRHMRPDSCSPVGSYGFTGCAAAMIRQWYAERRARREAEAGIP